jgi:hypothetical protein
MHYSLALDEKPHFASLLNIMVSAQSLIPAIHRFIIEIPSYVAFDIYINNVHAKNKQLINTKNMFPH